MSKPFLLFAITIGVIFAVPLIVTVPTEDFPTAEYIGGVLALATASVAILAVWGDRIRQLIGPDLVLQLKEHAPLRPEEVPGPPKKWIFHVRVSNRRRSAPARNAYVVITEIRREGSSEPEDLPGPLKIPWYFSQPNPTIGPMNTCDVEIEAAGGADCFLSPDYKPHGFATGACLIKASESVDVKLQARSENGDSAEYCLSIEGRTSSHPDHPLAKLTKCK